jgi:single-strand DNA-binding protein
MKDLNAVHLIGRLGQDPEVQYTDQGTARTTFSVATHRTWTDADGQVQTETEWTRCATWGKLAEIGGQYLHKGSQVYVAGRLHTSRWEDAQTGEPRSSVEIVVDDLILLDRPTPTAMPEDEQDAGEPQQSTPAASPRPSAQQPIRRPPRPVRLRDTTRQPSKRRRNDR